MFINFSLGRQDRPATCLGLSQLFFSDSPWDVVHFQIFTCFVISNFELRCFLADLSRARLLVHNADAVPKASNAPLQSIGLTVYLTHCGDFLNVIETPAGQQALPSANT